MFENEEIKKAKNTNIVTLVVLSNIMIILNTIIINIFKK